jgi:hypothetical protein
MVLLGLLMLIITPASSFAANDPVDDFTPRTKKIYLEPERSVLEKGKFKFILAGTAGYDNNVNLNSNRDGDSFIQSFFKGSFITPLSEQTNAKIDLEMMNLLYAGEPELDMTRNGIRLGLDHKLSKELAFSTAYKLDSIEYYNSGKDDFLDNSIELKLTQQLPHKMFHSVGYDLLCRSYDKRYTRDALTGETDKTRNDLRNSVSYEIGKYFKKDLVRLNVGYFNNDSNDPYLDYYDYDSYRFGATAIHLFNNKLSGMLSYSKQYRDYANRTLIVDTDTTEFEKTYMVTTGVLYSLNKSLSFGVNYIYRQNNSNEPIDNYSGSIVSVTTYYKF